MTMITPSYLGETIEYSSLHACRSTLEDPTCTVSAKPASGSPLLSSAVTVTANGASGDTLVGTDSESDTAGAACVEVCGRPANVAKAVINTKPVHLRRNIRTSLRIVPM